MKFTLPQLYLIEDALMSHIKTVANSGLDTITRVSRIAMLIDLYDDCVTEREKEAKGKEAPK